MKTRSTLTHLLKGASLDRRWPPTQLLNLQRGAYTCCSFFLALPLTHSDPASVLTAALPDSLLRPQWHHIPSLNVLSQTSSPLTPCRHETRGTTLSFVHLLLAFQEIAHPCLPSCLPGTHFQFSFADSFSTQLLTSGLSCGSAPSTFLFLSLQVTPFLLKLKIPSICLLCSWILHGDLSSCIQTGSSTKKSASQT